MVENDAPGGPGVPARWTSSAKSGVGRSLDSRCTVWYTSSHGILNEVYYPRIDEACIRDMGLVITDGQGFFSEEKRDTDSVFAWLEEGVGGFRIVNTCRQGRYRVEKEIFGDPHRDALVCRIRFVPLSGRIEDYHVHVLLSPHLGNSGDGNNGFVGDYKGVPMLFAERAGCGLALATDVPWGPRSVGYVGNSDGWQDLHQHNVLTWEYTRALNGNVALVGELRLGASEGRAELVLAFGRDSAEAGHRARWCLLRDFDHAREGFVRQWREWQATLVSLPAREHDLYRVSMTVLASHESTAFPGAFIASLSIPWGFARGDDDLGGYHLVWPRDLVETVGGLLAAGAHEEVHRVIHYLHAVQELDGHLPQNMWTDGRPYWGGFQLDETAFPILLIDMAMREQVLKPASYDSAWPMVERAARFLVRNGPVTQEDRWEEDAGYTPFTLAVEIAALLAAADFAEGRGETVMAEYLRNVADCWNDQIEDWIYVSGTELARAHGVDGYYVRISSPRVPGSADDVVIKNRPIGHDVAPAASIVSPDALALVRFGLRAADDPRIVSTVKVIDALLRAETPYGPCWRRYNEDGYGEHDDGTPFDGTGRGRLWPLLTGERGHYELAAGRVAEAEKMLAAMEGFANDGGMIPEQIWDSADIPEHDLYFARPAGSAMPLVWAHSEYIKLRRSLQDGRVFDMPPQTVSRYLKNGTVAAFTLWRRDNPTSSVFSDRRLRIESLEFAHVRWSADGWKTHANLVCEDSTVGIFYADLPLMAAGTAIEFTFYYPDADRWEGTNYTVTVADRSGQRRS